MATDLERLVVQLSADIKKYENALNKAMGVTNKRAKTMESRFAKMNRNISSGFGDFSVGVAKAFAVIGGARGFQTLLDSSTKIDNALKVAGLSGAELEAVYTRLRDSAIANAAPLEDLVQLYSRVALVQKELSVSSNDLTSFSNTVAMAIRVSGKSSQEASGALLQLSQALGSGVVRAEEFNSILEGAPTILQAAAAGIKEADGSVAKLRQIMLDGELSSKAFFEGIQAGAPILEQKLKGAVLTTEAGLTNLKTAMIDAVREFSSGSTAAKSLGEALSQMAQRINEMDFEQFGKQVRELVGWVRDAVNEINNITNAGNNFTANIAKALGTDKIGQKLAGSYLGGALVITPTLNIDASTATDAVQQLEAQINQVRTTLRENTPVGVDNSDAMAKLDGLVARLTAIKSDAAVTAEIGLDASGAEAKIAEIEREIDLLTARINANNELGFDNTEALARLAELSAQLEAIRAAAANPGSLTIGTGEAKGELSDIASELDKLQAAIASNTELGLDASGALAVLAGVSQQVANVKAQIASMSAGVAAAADNVVRGQINSMVPFNPIGDIPQTVKPISYKDYPATGGTTKSGGGGKGGGKGKKGGAGRENEYQREIEQIKERTAAIQAETAALAGVNPLIDDYDFAITKARASHDLLTAAQQAGIAITPELKAKIDELATGYANATVEANKQAEAQDRLRETADDLRDLGKDVLGGFISDLRNGKTAAEALEGALNKIADKLLDMTLESLFSGGGGWFSKLFGLKDGGAVKLAGGGRVSGPGGTRGDKIPALLSDQEHVVNAKAAKKYRPLLDAMNAGMPLKLANGGAVGVSAPRLARLPAKQATRGPQPVALTVRVDGATGNEEVKRMVAQGVSQGIGQYDKQVDRTFGARMAKAQMRQL